MTRIVSLFLMIVVLTSATVTQTLSKEPEAWWQLTDVQKRTHKPFDDQSTRGIVLVFISTDCPIANSYQPLLQRLASKHSQNGIRMFMIHPNPDLTVAQARTHASEFEIKVPVVIDADQSIARGVGATVTPQAFVFVRDEKTPAYQGRIDNLYAAYGKKRRVATSHELADALEAVEAGRPVKISKTKPLGCFISYEKSTQEEHQTHDR